MILPRRTLLQLGAAAVATTVRSEMAWTQGYPARPVRIFVGLPAGGLADIAARLIGQHLSGILGQPFLVENRVGAVTNVATEETVRAPPDGYTLLLATSFNAINAAVFNNLNFDFIRDIAPVASIADGALVLEVNPTVPAKTVPELIDYAKANPGKLKMASAGIGSPAHIAGELFKMMSGVDILHVPYRGEAPYLIDLVGGRVEIAFAPIAASVQFLKAGNLRALAVTTSVRSQALPGLPALSEFLPGFALSTWLGLGAPKNTPLAIIEILNKAVNAALADTDISARCTELGLNVHAGSPIDFRNLIAEDTEKMAKVVNFAHIKAD